MIILGIDPGTIITGWGVIEISGSSYETLDFGAIRPPKSLDIADRYLIIFEGVCSIIAQHKPSCVAIETQYMGVNPKSSMILGRAQGVAIVAARKHGCPVYTYAPSQIKSGVTGKGQASKHQVQQMTMRLLGLTEIPEPEDAADALACAIAHAHAHQFNKVLNGAALSCTPT